MIGQDSAIDSLIAKSVNLCERLVAARIERDEQRIRADDLERQLIVECEARHAAQAECERLKADLATNARMLARQCDLAREAENGAAADRAELLGAVAECAAMREALVAAQAWASMIAGDERVSMWVHQHDYGLYCLLADCPVDFDAALSGTAGSALLARLERYREALRQIAGYECKESPGETARKALEEADRG